MPTKRVPKVDTGDGIIVPAEMKAIRVNDIDGFTAKLTADYDSDAGRYVTRHLEIESHDGRELTGEMLRKVKVADLLRTATRGAFAPYMIKYAQLDEPAAAGPTDEVLRHVALVYRLALMCGDAPTAEVTAQLGVPRSTAGRWVTRARDRGLLTVTDPRAARGKA